MTPWLEDPDVRLYHGDCLDVLRQLPDRSVHMCATSPPFYGLRDYGTGEWEGGEEGCDHKRPSMPGKDSTSTLKWRASNQNHEREPWPGGNCGKCGARRVDRQIGLEETPDQWVERLVQVFREVRRVLRDDGTLWVEIGDSYTGPPRMSFGDQGRKEMNAANRAIKSPIPVGMKQKDLLGQPWLLAFALRADGWYLRSEIIWSKANPMPESVTDRPTKSHSTIFLLSKSPRYFYDADAIREAFSEPQGGRAHRRYPEGFKEDASGNGRSGRLQGPTPGQIAAPPETLGDLPPEAPRGPDGRRVTGHSGPGEHSIQERSNGDRWPGSGANARSVWTIPTEPTPFAHFATWPQALVRRMILAGTSERGCCPECGAPWVRETSVELEFTQRTHNATATRESMSRRGADKSVPGRNHVTTLGWSPSCTHDTTPVPSTVLDPFAGSGTTSLVARNHGRHSIGIELNEQYLQIAAKRLQQLSLLAEGTV